MPLFIRTTGEDINKFFRLLDLYKLPKQKYIISNISYCTLIILAERNGTERNRTEQIQHFILSNTAPLKCSKKTNQISINCKFPFVRVPLILRVSRFVLIIILILFSYIASYIYTITNSFTRWKWGICMLIPNDKIKTKF